MPSLHSVPRIFEAYPELVFGFSDRTDGNMRLASVDDMRTKENREQYFHAEGIESTRVVAPVLVHGTHVRKVRSEDAGSIFGATDALITNEPNVYLTLTAADCLPVYMYDPVRRVIALVHAGWRGLAVGILTNVASIFTASYGSSADDLRVFIGAGICGKCYQVGPEVVEKFAEHPQALAKNEKGILLDLKRVARDELLSLGVLETNIETSADCTFENPERYYSFRRDRPAEPEAMVAVLGMRS